MFNFVLMNEKGERVLRYFRSIKTNTTLLLSIKDEIANQSKTKDISINGKFTLLGVCENASLVPLVLNYNKITNTIIRKNAYKKRTNNRRTRNKEYS